MARSKQQRAKGQEQAEGKGRRTSSKQQGARGEGQAASSKGLGAWG